MNIKEFALAWRWTASSHAVLAESVLSQMQPLEMEEAKRACARSLAFPQNLGTEHSADVSDEEGTRWLREQHSILSDIVTISWSPELALRTSWGIFTEHWSDFCYPASDDVAVWPVSEEWVLFYHHHELFQFLREPNQAAQTCGPHEEKKPRLCPYCGAELFTERSQQCLSCGWDWHDLEKPIQHVVKKRTNQSAQTTPGLRPSVSDL